jgi:hypothetical protein
MDALLTSTSARNAGISMFFSAHVCLYTQALL